MTSARSVRSITAELRTIIDYHNCRVYLLEPNGRTLTPVAFRGELFDEYGQETSSNSSPRWARA